MKILTMTATFGCLDEATLHLSDGVNLLCLSNESGKSTWAAFLQAMFYGIDTSQRASKGILPEKARWQPWNGKAMCGTVELEHRGRRMILQRTSQRGRPMSVFRAYDPETGLEISELTGENCGRYFFGVEKSVFQRCAFLSGSELAVTANQDLSKRLENLASSGDMEDSYPAADARLKLWKNRHRYHQNGLIPEKEAQLLQSEGRVERLSELRRQTMEASAACEAIKTEAETLEQAERSHWEEKKEASQRAVLEAMERMEQAERSWKETGLPYDLMNQLRDNLLYLEKNPLPPEEACPPALQGLAYEEFPSKMAQDWENYHRLLEHESRASLWLRLSLVCGLLAIAAAVGKIWWALLLCLCGAAVGLALYGRIRLRKQRAQQILQSYQIEDIHFLEHVEKKRANWMLAQVRHRNALGYRDALVEELRAADSTIKAEDVTLAWVEQKLNKYKEAVETARRELEEVKPGLIKESAPFPPSPELMRLREKAAGLKAQAVSLRQQEGAGGSLEAAQYRCEQLRQELDDLYRREQALELAREALESAHSQLEQVYAPQLTGLAGEYLQKLTGNRYDALVLGRDWQLQARETATGLTRPLASLSSGTQDQVWLALRLAMAELLLPEASPLVLDDALLTFDDKRTELAVALLRQTGRQVILFSCRTL